MDRSEWFRPKWQWLKRFAMAGALGLVIIMSGTAMDLPGLAVLGVVLLVPLLFWLAFVPVLHWKDRYIGEHGDVWGGFLAFEASGWSKLVYWFRHVLPDWHGAGRYRDAV